MNINYETQGTITYGVYQIQPEDVVDTMALGMLTNNKIPGLATTQFTQMDSDRFIKFNVSAKIPVSQFFSGQVNRKRLVGVFKGIVAALLSAEDYMIEPSSILLDLDYIFTDVSTCETVLICLPIQKEKAPVDLTHFFKNIMFSTQFDQTENCDYVAKIMNYLNSAPTLSLTDFNELMIQIERGGGYAPQPAVPQQAAPAPQQPAPQRPVGPQQPPVAPQGQPMPMAPQGQPMPMQQPPVQRPAAPQQPPMPNAGQQRSIPMPNGPQGFQPPQPTGQRSAPNGPQGFQVPGQQPQIPPQGQPAQAPGGKKMSFMGLMMHYSKENAALYKAQKEAGKNGAPMPNAPQGTAIPPAPEKGKKDKKNKKGQPQPQAYPVPGAPGGGFAVPGQGAPPIQPGGSSIPSPMGQPMNRQAAPQPQQAPAQQQPMRPMQPMQQPTQAPVFQPPVSAPMGQPMSFGETTVLGGGGGAIGETTVLGGAVQQNQPKPTLIRSKNNERISVDKPVFRIGKERSYVDYFIGDNSAISRSHANILTRDGEYFIVDTNSTNHTYVNGTMIQSNTEVKLAHGSIVRLANEEFEFKLF